jgi:fructosamine-3-kinase
MDASLRESLAALLHSHVGADADIVHADPIGGGSINDAFRLDTKAGLFFVKANTSDRFSSMFEAEADGLRRLAGTEGLCVPHVIASGESQHRAYLLLEWVEPGIKNGAFWELLGTGLARLHGRTSSRFGLDRDNYIGSLKQVNAPRDQWDTFFIDCRLEPLTRMARDSGRLDEADAFRFERLYGKLPHLFPLEPAALLHGDLWSGNVLCDAASRAVLIDPAVYYGHREMDLGMTRLFGGFDPDFYAAYQAYHPLEQGWEERMPLAQLYPLLVHAVLFGGSYTADARAILRKFT